VWVGPGTYEESGLSYGGKAVVLMSTHGAERTVIEGEGKQIMRFTSGEGRDSVLDGFTLTHGSAPFGGALYIEGSSPTLSNCNMRENSAMGSSESNGASGGAVFMFESSVIFEHCSFTENRAGVSTQYDVSPTGGAIGIMYSNPEIINCSFTRNMSGSLFSTGFGAGGGIRMYASEALIEDCSFVENSVNDVTNGEGGAIHAYSSLVLLYNSVFYKNEAGDGGAAYLFLSQSLIKNSSFVRNLAITAETNGRGNGGGLLIYGDSVNPEIQNCRLSENKASNYGGGIHILGGHANIRRSTLTMNEAQKGCALYFDSLAESNYVHIDNSIFA